ncbi:MAG: hypothetical protein FWF57_02145 [Defluviitaleaceae bacterium]|nr:hypothetical protein [Defluviitaleaceae bacterium]
MKTITSKLVKTTTAFFLAALNRYIGDPIERDEAVMLDTPYDSKRLYNGTT